MADTFFHTCYIGITSVVFFLHPVIYPNIVIQGKNDQKNKEEKHNKYSAGLAYTRCITVVRAQSRT